LEKFKVGTVDNDDEHSKKDITPIRKVGIKVSNLSKKDKAKLPSQKTLFDYL